MSIRHLCPFAQSFVLAVSIAASRGDTLVVPNANENAPGPGGGLSLPFRGSQSRWQQTYISSEFGSASGNLLQINELRFRIDEEQALGSPFSTVVHGLSIFMSTTTKSFATASVVYAQNIEQGLFEAFPEKDLTLNGVRSSGTSFDVVIPLPNAFVYDRNSGNLLVDIRVAGTSVLPTLDQTGLPNSTFSVGGGLAFPTGTLTSQGLVTQFGFVVVPEPSIVALFMLGSASLILRRTVSRCDNS